MARLATHEWGDPAGAPVVCLHGVTGHGERFGALAARLPGRRVVAFDLRGHGRSTWEAPWTVETHVADLVETARSLGVERATWLGHSFGGRLVAELATREPLVVERAVLVDPALHVAPADATARAEGMRADMSFATPDEAIDARLADGTLFTTPRSMLEDEAKMHLERHADGLWRWRYSPASVIAAWSVMASAAPPLPAAPTLVVLGERSWIPNAIPARDGVVVVRVPGGHSILWDDFDAAAEAVASFLAAA
ncbi:MAG TPA: alpha/beta hydrolase [Gaiella sp.]